MGAYGSPEFLPNSVGLSRKDTQNAKKLQRKNVAIGLQWVLIFLLVFALAIVANSKAQIVSKAAISSTPALVSSSPISSTPAIVDHSSDCLKAWAKTAVLKALVNSSTAKFSDKASDWKIVWDGKKCEITSAVTAIGRKSKQSSKMPFVVRISYNGLKANITYVSLSGQVCYNASISSKITRK